LKSAITTLRVRILALGVIFVLLAVFYRQASAEFDPKVCFERCMERAKDREKCEYICDPKEVMIAARY